jgi:hypothetical protein
VARVKAYVERLAKKRAARDAAAEAFTIGGTGCAA